MDKISQQIKKLEKALFESEEKLSIIASLSYDWLWQWDITIGEIKWMGEIDTFEGYDKNYFPITIDAWEKMLHPADKEKVLNSLKDHHNKNIKFHEKYRVFNKNGEIRWWDTRGMSLWDDNGKPLSMTGTVTDITEKKLHATHISELQKQNEANKIQNNFFNMLDQLPVCFHIQNNDHSVPFANKMFKDRFGDPEKGMCYQLMHNRVKPCDPCPTFKSFDSLNTETSIWKSPDEKTYMTVTTPFYSSGGELQLMEMSIDISEQKKVEESLAVSENQFQTIFEESPLGLALIESLTGKIIQVNNYFSKIAGRSKNELKGLTWMDLTHSDDIDQDLQNYKNLNSGKIDRYNIEKRYIKPDGKEGWIHKTVAKIAVDDNKHIHLAMIEDITEQKKTQESLAISENQFRTIFKESPLGVALIDSLTGHIYQVNRKFADIVGRSLSEMANIDWMSITHPDDVQEDLDNMSALNAGNITGFNMEKRYIKPDGFFVWINMTISPLTVENKNSPRHLCMIEDITEKKKSEKALTRFGRVLSSSSNEIYMFDSSTLNFTQVNSGACKNIGYSIDELYQMTPIDLKPEHNLETFQKLIDPLIEKKESIVNFETVHKRKDGTLYPINVKLQLINEESPPLFVAIIEDITVRKKVEAQLEKYQNNLEEEILKRTLELKDSQDKLVHTEKLSTLGKFAGTVAHEFNNPLFGVINLIEQMGEDLGEEKRKKFSDLAQKECWRMADMIKNLQSFYKPSNEIFSRADMKRVLEDILLIIGKACKNKGIIIKKKYNNNEYLFTAIEDQIKQVLLNVLQNSIDSISYGGTIALNIAQTSKEIIVEIQDTGHGIEKEIQKFIFEPFYTTRGKEGTGLGLSVCYGIMKKHGGNIAIESEPDLGATVSLILPIKQKIQ